MRAVVVLAALSVACATSPIEVKRWEAGELVLDVSIKPSNYGRGCTDAIIRPDGEVLQVFTLVETGEHMKCILSTGTPIGSSSYRPWFSARRPELYPRRRLFQLLGNAIPQLAPAVQRDA